MQKILPKNGVDIIIPVQELRECCGCEDKYPAFGSFKKKVIDMAVSEINRVTSYVVTFDYLKTGRSVTSIRFHVNMMYH